MNQFGWVNRAVALFFSLLNINKLPERQNGQDVIISRVKDSVIAINGEKEFEKKGQGQNIEKAKAKNLINFSSLGRC